MKLGEIRDILRNLQKSKDVSHLVIKPTVEGVQKMMVGALITVGVDDAVQVGEVPVQVHVVGIFAPQKEILAALQI